MHGERLRNKEVSSEQCGLYIASHARSIDMLPDIHSIVI